VVIPGALIRIAAKKNTVLCDKHGWQNVERKILPVEAVNLALGRPLEYREPPLPDEPPF
jgi:hypothetical protein